MRRLLWLNESRLGIYLGVLGAPDELHFSYHRDGRRHTKIGREYDHKTDDIPIVEVRGIRQLQHSVMVLDPNWLAHHGPCAGDQKTRTVVLLDDRVFKSGKQFALDVWLLDRESESQIFDFIGKALAVQSGYDPVAEIIIALDSFPDHKVALTFRAANASGESGGNPVASS